jgi:tetratricopeptide (TPR) repeat protein
MLGRSDLSLGEYSDARSSFRRALRAQPDLEEARLGIGIAYMEQERWDSAARTFEEWQELNPRAVGAWTGLASAHYGAGRLVEAEKAARVALEIEPNDMQAHRILGEVSYAREDFPAALYHWRQASRDGSQASELELIVKDMEKYLAKYGESSPTPTE